MREQFAKEREVGFWADPADFSDEELAEVRSGELVDVRA
jgi:hypothetical protein